MRYNKSCFIPFLFLSLLFPLFYTFLFIHMDISKLLVSNTEVVTNYSKPSLPPPLPLPPPPPPPPVKNDKKRHACTWPDCNKTFSMYIEVG